MVAGLSAAINPDSTRTPLLPSQLLTLGDLLPQILTHDVINLPHAELRSADFHDHLGDVLSGNLQGNALFGQAPE